MATIEGGFIWYELMTGDVAAAEAFYAKVLGWNMEDAGMPGGHYTLAKVGSRQVAGIMDIPADANGAGPVWFGYIRVADVDTAAERVRGAGGAVHRAPSDIPGVGRFAVVADPQGAAFMLFRGDGTPAADLAPGTPGSIGWHELRARDWTSAFSFYHDMFGWQKSDAVDMGPMGVYQVFSINGTGAGGMMNSAEAPPWLYYFCVENIDAAVTRVADGGGRVTNGPNQVPGGSWIVHAIDPQGATFAVVGPRQ